MLLHIRMRIHTAVLHQDKSTGNQASLVLLITEKKKKNFYNRISSSFNREETRVNDLVFKGKSMIMEYQRKEAPVKTQIAVSRQCTESCM